MQGTGYLNLPTVAPNLHSDSEVWGAWGRDLHSTGTDREGPFAPHPVRMAEQLEMRTKPTLLGPATLDEQLLIRKGLP